MSLKETGFTFAEKLTTSGEIQEDGEIDDLRCLNPPGNRYIWDGARANWFHEETWPLDKRSKMWYLCHGQIAAVTEERGLPNFLVIPREHLNEEDLPGYDPLEDLYGAEIPPTTPANAVTTGATNITEQ